jgi:hypothetical protein
LMDAKKYRSRSRSCLLALSEYVYSVFVDFLFGAARPETVSVLVEPKPSAKRVENKCK